jgi:hypothetical protein
MREIRFSIDRDWARAAHGDSGFERALPVTNSWGGRPTADKRKLVRGIFWLDNARVQGPAAPFWIEGTVHR